MTSYGFTPSRLSEKLQDFPPRGPNTERLAGHCSIGPFGKTDDVGLYEGFCSKLTNGEKCLAYLKQHIDDEGQIHKAEDRAKAIFCLNSILSKVAD